MLSDRYYTEDFDSGAPPLPYRAYLRIRLERTGAAEEERIVLRRQTFRPIQDGSLAGSREPYNYHGVEFRETETVFDRGWRFLSERRWAWGVPGGDYEEFRNPTRELTYGIWRSAPGHVMLRAEEEGTSMHAILRRAVDDYLARTAHEALVRKAAKEQTAKWAELLERLK